LANSATRVKECLDALAGAPAGLTVTELAQKLGVSKPSSSRLLGGLVESGLAERSPETQRHALSVGLWIWGVAALNRLRIADAALLPMTQVAKSCNITVYLSINSGLQTVAIQRVDQTLDFILVRPVSSPVPAYTSAVGKAILAYGPREAVDEVCRAGLESYTPRLSRAQRLCWLSWPRYGARDTRLIGESIGQTPMESACPFSTIPSRLADCCRHVASTQWSDIRTK
jgi:DNA-binding IclR family transcriptional regulator